MENHNLQLTQLEQKTLTALIEFLYAEPGFSDVDALDIAQSTGMPTTSIRGVLSSLVKKQIICIEESKNWDIVKGRWKLAETHQLIYLQPEYWYLHPDWKKYATNL